MHPVAAVADSVCMARVVAVADTAWGACGQAWVEEQRRRRAQGALSPDELSDLLHFPSRPAPPLLRYLAHSLLRSFSPFSPSLLLSFSRSFVLFYSSTLLLSVSPSLLVSVALVHNCSACRLDWR
eukprot:2726581-Rhodomonas_salina.1